MIAEAQHVLHFFTQQRGTQRQPAGQTLGGGHHVGLHAVIHISVQLARSAVAGLHLVHHEHNVLFFAQRGHCLNVLLGKRHHTALALDAFDQDAGDFDFSRQRF